jgi:hypothetical protein
MTVALATISALLAMTTTLHRAAAAQAQASPPVMSLEEVRKMHDAGQYRSALQEAARALSASTGTKENAAPSPDMYELQWLRGDSLLHLDDAQTALSALMIAEKSPDPKIFAASRGTALLIRNSRELKYTPKKGGDPIDIVDDASRKRAAAALLEDRLAADQKRIDAAASADNLKPIIAVIEPLLDLRALEELATGSAAQTKPLAMRVGDRARDLIARELARLNDQVKQYERIANQIQDDGGRGVTRRGLISTQRQDLRDIIDYLGQIRATVERGLQLARLHGGAVAEWEQIAHDTSEIQHHASNVLAAE